MTNFSLSPDGGTVGISGKGKFKVGGEIEHITPFYDLKKLTRVGVPIKSGGPGIISNGGNTAMYRDGLSKIVAHDIKTGKQTDAVEYNEKDYNKSFHAYSPDGTLLVTSDKTRLTFRPWPASGKPLEVDTKAPILALSQVFQQGTRVATILGEGTGAVIRVWDTKTGQAVDELPLNRPPQTGGFAAERLLVAEDGKTTIVVKPGGGEEIWDLSSKKKSSWAVPTATTVQPVSGGLMSYKQLELKIEGTATQTNEMIAVADAQTGDIVQKLALPKEIKSTLNLYYASSADGKRFVAVCDDTHRIYIWDLPK